MSLVVNVMCVSLNLTPMILVLLYHIVSYCIFFAPNGKFVFSACLFLSVFYTSQMRFNKVKAGRGLLTRLLYGTA